jgi:hypothetical protein
MPAVAQISVNFAQLSQIRSDANTSPTNVRVVSPRTLTQYLLSNREQPYGEGANTAGNSDAAYLNYQGGFISAGNKVNVKHDSDLQLRQNLDVEQSVFADNIYARRKGNTIETYQDNRKDTVRSITLAPFVSDLSTNNISITTTNSTKNIGLFMDFGNQGENSIILENTTSDKKLNVKTGVFRIDAADLDIYGAPVFIDETVEINKETTITDNLKVTGNLSLGTTSYNKFTIASATGNVAFAGNLNINTDKFTVASATGNTVIAGTLNISNNISLNSSDEANRSIIGLSNKSVSDFLGSTIDTHAINITDIKSFTTPENNAGTGRSLYTQRSNSSGRPILRKIVAGSNISVNINAENNIEIENTAPLGLYLNLTGYASNDIITILNKIFPVANFSIGTQVRVWTNSIIASTTGTTVAAGSVSKDATWALPSLTWIGGIGAIGASRITSWSRGAFGALSFTGGSSNLSVATSLSKAVGSEISYLYTLGSSGWVLTQTI